MQPRMVAAHDLSHQLRGHEPGKHPALDGGLPLRLRVRGQPVPIHRQHHHAPRLRAAALHRQGDHAAQGRQSRVAGPLRHRAPLRVHPHVPPQHRAMALLRFEVLDDQQFVGGPRPPSRKNRASCPRASYRGTSAVRPRGTWATKPTPSIPGNRFSIDTLCR